MFLRAARDYFLFHPAGGLETNNILRLVSTTKKQNKTKPDKALRSPRMKHLSVNLSGD